MTPSDDPPDIRTPEGWRRVIGVQLEAGRKARGIDSMREAARIAGFSDAVWRQLESGRRSTEAGRVVAPRPRIGTLIAAAMTAGLDAGRLAADAGFTAADIEHAEDYEGSFHRAQARNSAGHEAVAQTMYRDAEGKIGFHTGPAPGRHQLAVQLDQMMTAVWADLSLAGREKVVWHAQQVQIEELAALGGVDGLEHTIGRPIRKHEISVPTDRDFAVAADRGSADPHDDEVGDASVRHPGGSRTADHDGA